MKKLLLSLAALAAVNCAQAQVLYEGSDALSWSGVKVNGEIVTATSDVTLSITIETTADEWWQFKLVSAQDWSVALQLADGDFVNSNNAIPGSYVGTAGTYTFDYQLTEDQITLVKSGLFAQGSINAGEIKLLKVEAKSGSSDAPVELKNVSAKVDYTSQWATVKLTTHLPFTFDQYVAYKVVLENTEGEPDDNGVYFNILCESVETHKQTVDWSNDPIDESDCILYDNVREVSGTYEGELKERMAEKNCTAGIRTLALQYTNKKTMSTVIKAVYLKTAAGEWERQSINPLTDSWTNTKVTILDDQMPTGIQAVQAEAKSEMFNLAGQCVNAAKGLFVKNGKIMMVK